MQYAASLTAILVSVAGVVQAHAGLRAVRRQQARPRHRPTSAPGITILKPLCGAEPMLEQALESFFLQDYGRFQIVFGVHDPCDPACLVVERLQRRHPDVDVTLVASPALHGRNRKVGNLINCQAAAKHDILVVADSDVHVSTDYLATIAAELECDGTGLVTAAYRGLAANASLAARLGRMQIDQTFLPGVLLSRRLGRQDCLGATMAIRRGTLALIGGFEALGDHLDDDNRLGRLVVASGRGVAMMPGVVAVTVPEASLRELFRHELRWGRIVRLTAPVGFACSVVQYPVAWAAASVACSGAAWWTLMTLVVTWVARGLITTRTAIAVGTPAVLDPSLLLPRDVMSIAVIIASFCGSRVKWRGVKFDCNATVRRASASGAVRPSGNEPALTHHSEEQTSAEVRHATYAVSPIVCHGACLRE